ncbi:MAG: hypothetical protein HC939_20920 [Pleurocapsa sp. SU_5_0]|nr:hypothetical protein [Pleurocapsa sp. SU_5_0]
MRVTVGHYQPLSTDIAKMNLLIVESPGKIKKLKTILGANWKIMASFGHFRTLTKDGENNLGFDFAAIAS